MKPVDRRDLAICAALDRGVTRVAIARMFGISKAVVDKLAIELIRLDRGETATV